MDLVRLLGRLNAIGGMQGSVTEEKKPDADKDGVPDWADKKPGADDTEDKKEKANEDIFNVLKGLRAIQETSLDEEDVEEGNEFAQKVQQLKSQGAKPGTKFKTSDGKEHVLEADDHCSVCDKPSDKCVCDDEKLDECGDMDMSPLTAMADANGMPAGTIDVQQPTSPEVNPAGGYDDATDAYPGQENGPAEVEEKPRYTLTIQNGDSNLSMTTDMADEIIHIMKLAGVNKGAEVTKKEIPADGKEDEKEVDEAWGNTPAATNEKEPKAYGDIRDWGMKGTANAKTHQVPAKSGDNPMSESAMLKEYKLFKAGK